MNGRQPSRKTVLAFGVVTLLISGVFLWLHWQNRDLSQPVQESPPPDNREFSQPGAGRELNIPTAVTSIDDGDTAYWRSVRIFVQDKFQRPVGHATIRVKFDQLRGGMLRPREQSLQTDAQGFVEVKYPADFKSDLQLHVSHDAANPGEKFVVWNSLPEVPAKYTITLARTTAFGGEVVDEFDRPVPGAQVQFYRFCLESIETYKRNQGEYCDFRLPTVTTDASGYWRARGIPLALIDRVGFEVSHPEFVARGYGDKLSESDWDALQAGRFRIVLRRGAVVHVRVLNEFDEPLPEANVEARGATNQTDVAGRVSFSHLSKGRVQFNITARGYQPESRSVTNHSETEEVVVQLKPGQLIRGVVQNEAGEPLAHVQVWVGSWSVPQARAFYRSTDATGRFEWDAAPWSPQAFSFWSDGYARLTNVVLKPVVENVVTLKRLPQIHGWVLNAATGEPVKQFRIGTGKSLEADPFRRGGTKPFSSPDGRFSFDVFADGVDLIRAEGSGYASQTQSILAGQFDQPVVFRLDPAPALRGRVVSTTGAPLAGVDVLWARKSQPVTFDHGRLRSRTDKTDANGQFVIAIPPTAGVILAVNPTGIGHASASDVEAGHPIRLQPYGRIQGKYLRAGRPAVRHWVQFRTDVPGLEMDSFGCHERTDEDGNFTFQTIPPGAGAVIGLGRTPSDYEGDEVPMTVRPGETVGVVIQD